MALARTYYSVNGEIIGEHRQGEANSRDYTRDSLGSVIAVYQNDWEIAEATYKPYGEMIGGWNFSDYRFGWNGAHGYRRTNIAWTTHYVRARHYSQIGANWTTRDPLWPSEMPYGYVNGMVMKAVDPSGTNAHPAMMPLPPIKCNGAWNDYINYYCKTTTNAFRCDALAREYRKQCKRPIDKGGEYCYDNASGNVIPCHPKIPHSWMLPPGESIISNCCETIKHMGDLGWFNNNIGYGTRWDYKTISQQYLDAGNWHYGFLSQCLNIDISFSLRAAGFAQQRNKKAPKKPQWGKPWDIGNTAHGDDPDDQLQIMLGYMSAALSDLQDLCSCKQTSTSTPIPNYGISQVNRAN